MTAGVTSIGYPQDIGKTNVDWANLQLGLGRRYMVADPTAAKVSPKSDGTRQVNIAPGVIGGWGVLDTITATQTITLDPVASGTRWFLIAARRTWSAAGDGTVTGETTFVAIDAGTTNSTLPARNTDGNKPGGSGVDDQPLALVPLTAGDTVPGTPIDIRAVGAGGLGLYLAADQLALQYMAWPGVEIRIGNTTWRRTMTSSGGSAWEADPTIMQSGPGLGNSLKVDGATGWITTSERVITATKSGATLTLDLEARRSGADLNFSDNQGSLTDAQGLVMTVRNTDWCPPRILPFSFEYFGSSGASFTGGMVFGPDGAVRIISGQPLTNVGKKAAGDVSFRAHLVWNKEN